MRPPEHEQGPFYAAAKDSSKVSTSDAITMNLLEIRPMLVDLFPPRIQRHRGAKYFHPPTQKTVRLVNEMLKGYLEDMSVLVEMNLVVCGSLKPDPIKWWKVMNCSQGGREVAGVVRECRGEGSVSGEDPVVMAGDYGKLKKSEVSLVVWLDSERAGTLFGARSCLLVSVEIGYISQSPRCLGGILGSVSY